MCLEVFHGCGYCGAGFYSDCLGLHLMARLLMTQLVRPGAHEPVKPAKDHVTAMPFESESGH